MHPLFKLKLAPAVWKHRFIGVLPTLRYKCRSIHLNSFQFLEVNPQSTLKLKLENSLYPTRPLKIVNVA